MASGNLDTVRAIHAAANARDVDAASSRWAEDAVLDYTNSRGPEAGVYRTPDERRRLWAGLLDAWGEIRWEAEETIEAAGGRILIVNRMAGRGRGSDVPVTATGIQLWTLRDGRVTAFKLFQSLDEALAELDSDTQARLARARLYFVCDARPHDDDSRPLLDAALRGGADLIQLRDKELRDDELVAAAKPFREAADEHGALFILNDRPNLVAACEADGVHVGQDDTPVAEARAEAGAGALVGLSTHTAVQVDAACSAVGDARPDQISVGPVWATPTKEGRPATGLGLIEHAARAARRFPSFAIGGIDGSNVAEVVAAGAERIVVVRAIRDAADPEAAARELRAALERAA